MRAFSWSRFDRYVCKNNSQLYNVDGMSVKSKKCTRVTGLDLASILLWGTADAEIAHGLNSCRLIQPLQLVTHLIEVIESILVWCVFIYMHEFTILVCLFSLLCVYMQGSQ